MKNARIVEFGNSDKYGLLLKRFDSMGEDFAKEIVIKSKKITIQVTYPLSTEYEFVMESDNGFSREELYKGVFDAYQEVYKDADTENSYGIWGHSIGDLVLVNMTEIKKNVFGLGVDS